MFSQLVGISPSDNRNFVVLDIVASLACIRPVCEVERIVTFVIVGAIANLRSVNDLGALLVSPDGADSLTFLRGEVLLHDQPDTARQLRLPTTIARVVGLRIARLASPGAANQDPVVFGREALLMSDEVGAVQHAWVHPTTGAVVHDPHSWWDPFEDTIETHEFVSHGSDIRRQRTNEVVRYRDGLQFWVRTAAAPAWMAASGTIVVTLVGSRLSTWRDLPESVRRT
jgi:hypothetical protein